MISVTREAESENICNACLDRELKTHKVEIGKSYNSTTVLNLCPNCLDALYCDIAEALNY